MNKRQKKKTGVSALERKLKKEILSKAKFDLVKTLTLDELQTISSILTSAEERLNGGLK